MKLSIRHDPFPVAAPYHGIYAHGVETRGNARLLHVSGQIGIAPDGQLAADFTGQCRQALENVFAVLAAAQMTRAEGPSLGHTPSGAEPGTHPVQAQLEQTHLRHSNSDHSSHVDQQMAAARFQREAGTRRPWVGLDWQLADERRSSTCPHLTQLVTLPVLAATE